MEQKHSNYFIIGFSLVALFVVCNVFIQLNKKHYRNISLYDIKVLYGWFIEPRENKLNSDYIFSLHKKDSLDFNVKPVSFYSVHKISDIKLPYYTTFDEFQELLELEDSSQVWAQLKLVNEVFKATGALRIVSDLNNFNVIYFTYGRRIQTLLLYVPEYLPNEAAYVTDGYKRINTNWYYIRRLRTN